MSETEHFLWVLVIEDRRTLHHFLAFSCTIGIFNVMCSKDLPLTPLGLWLLPVPPDLRFQNFTSYERAHVCFVWISQQIAIIFLHSGN
jgi:hypothetical protein